MGFPFGLFVFLVTFAVLPFWAPCLGEHGDSGGLDPRPENKVWTSEGKCKLTPTIRGDETARTVLGLGLCLRLARSNHVVIITTVAILAYKASAEV